MLEKFAPIIIFAFNRPRHLKKTLDALANCAESKNSDLTIYCDAARQDSEADAVAAVRSIAKGESRFASCKVIEASINKGLARSIIDGVSETVNQFGRVIVLEDDIVVGSNFLKFMNSGLVFYASQPEVASICAYMYPINPDGLPPIFLLKGTDCWGWATWKRAWDIFEPDGSVLLNKIKSQNLKWAFDLDGSYPYFTMLEDQIEGKNNSWAIRWHASAYLKGMVSCFPRDSLVENIGFDGSGVHCANTTNFFNANSTSKAHEFQDFSGVFPENVVESNLARTRIIEFFLSITSKKRLLIRAFKKIFHL